MQLGSAKIVVESEEHQANCAANDEVAQYGTARISLWPQGLLCSHSSVALLLSESRNVCA